MFLFGRKRIFWKLSGTNTLDFFYDESGHPYALTYNGTTYYYVTNLQGDVLHILNSSKQVVASYTYDPTIGRFINADSYASTGHLEYSGTIGRYYKAYVTVWAGKDGAGDSRSFWTSSQKATLFAG